LTLQTDAKKEKNQRLFYPEKKGFKDPLEFEIDLVKWIYSSRRNEIPIAVKALSD